eukprot:9960869-Alexandrium_andersonii.AAC.1
MDSKHVVVSSPRACFPCGLRVWVQCVHHHVAEPMASAWLGSVVVGAVSLEDRGLGGSDGESRGPLCGWGGLAVSERGRMPGGMVEDRIKSV